MSWKTKLWSACGMVIDTAIDLTANTFNVVGSIACMVGGAAYSFSQVLDESLNASYYGAADTYGVVTIDASLASIHFQTNESFHQQEKALAGIKYNLQDYINPVTVRQVSTIFVASGSALRLMGDNIRLWRQGKIDQAFYKSEHNLEITRPSRIEHFYASAESVCGSLTYTCAGIPLAGIPIQLSKLVGSHQDLTFPANGVLWVNTTHYSGPLASKSFPLSYKFGRNYSIDFFHMKIRADIEERVEAVANTSYGGGLFFQSNAKTNPPIAIPAVIGLTLSRVNNSFFRSGVVERDKRIAKSKVIVKQETEIKAVPRYNSMTDKDEVLQCTVV